MRIYSHNLREQTKISHLENLELGAAVTSVLLLLASSSECLIMVSIATVMTNVF